MVSEASLLGHSNTCVNRMSLTSPTFVLGVIKVPLLCLHFFYTFCRINLGDLYQYKTHWNRRALTPRWAGRVLHYLRLRVLQTQCQQNFTSAMIVFSWFFAALLLVSSSWAQVTNTWYCHVLHSTFTRIKNTVFEIKSSQFIYCENTTALISIRRHQEIKWARIVQNYLWRLGSGPETSWMLADDLRPCEVTPVTPEPRADEARRARRTGWRWARKMSGIWINKLLERQ